MLFINYFVSKLASFDPLPPFLLSKVYVVNRLWGYPPPPLARRHSLWTAPNNTLHKTLVLKKKLIQKKTYLFFFKCSEKKLKRKAILRPRILWYSKYLRSLLTQCKFCGNLSGFYVEKIEQKFTRTDTVPSTQDCLSVCAFFKFLALKLTPASLGRHCEKKIKKKNCKDLFLSWPLLKL